MSGTSPGLWHPALLALLPLTGFLVFHSDREELPWPARTALGTAWVISLLTIAVFLLHLVGITPSAVRILFIAIPAVALLRRRARIFGRPAGLSGRESLWLALALTAVAALAFGPHFWYRFPLHADEFWHAAFANKIIETRHLFFDPNLSMRIVHAETGFHALLAGILLLTGLDPLTQYGFLAALLATLTALALYALLREIAGARHAGLSAALLYEGKALA
jgi:hypothetical protein